MALKIEGTKRDTVPLNLNVSTELNDKIMQMVLKHKSDRSKIVRAILEDFFEREEQKKNGSDKKDENRVKARRSVP